MKDTFSQVWNMPSDQFILGLYRLQMQLCVILLPLFVVLLAYFLYLRFKR